MTRCYSQFWLDYCSGRIELNRRFAERDEDEIYALIEPPDNYKSGKVHTDDRYKMDGEFSFDIDKVMS